MAHHDIRFEHPRGAYRQFIDSQGMVFYTPYGEGDATMCKKCGGRGRHDSCFDCGNRGWLPGPDSVSKALEELL